MNLPEPLMQAVRQRAVNENRTQTSVIEEAIRRFLNELPPAPRRAMPTFGTPGQNALLIDLEDKEALYDALDEDGLGQRNAA